MSEESTLGEMGSTPPAEAQLEAFKRLFPGVLVDGVLDAGRLGQLLDIEVTELPQGKEIFGLTWAGKKKAAEAVQAPSYAALVPDFDASINWDTAENVFIEGDNLEVLKLMQNAYNDKIKVIYIDPPYNTGNDFVYNDDFSDPKQRYLEVTGQVDAEGNRLTSNPEISGRKHSNWLNMMYPRLALARNLLTEDGVIFVSIDDREIHNLRSLMDSIFGEENFIGTIKRRAARKTAFLSKTMSDMCDYVVIYARGELSSPLSAGSVSDGSRPVLQTNNKVSKRIVRAGTPANCPDGTYSKIFHDEATLSSEIRIEGGRVKNDVEIEARWRVNQQILDETLFLTKNLGLRRTILAEELEKQKLLSDLLDDPTCYNELGSEEVASILGGSYFDSPKPTGLVTKLLKAVNDKDCTVLDFFAGSGTTGHAVELLNAEDGGSRRYICVTLDEPTPQNSAAREAGLTRVSEITEARLIKVADLNSESSRRGLRVLRLSASSYKPFFEEDGALVQLSASTKSKTFSQRSAAAEVLLKQGIPLDSPWTGDNVIQSGQVLFVGDDVDQLVLEQIPDHVGVVVVNEDALVGKDAVKAKLHFDLRQVNKKLVTY